MKQIRLVLLFSLSLVWVMPSHAQWAVFDSTNYANALHEYAELKQIYTTATQTRDQIIQAYNLAHYMSQMPQNLYQRYFAPFTQWTNLSAPNTYGNTSTWIQTLNLGGIPSATQAYLDAIVQPLAYPSAEFAALDSATQATVKNQYATSELSQGITTSTLSTLGQIRSHSESLNQQIQNLEADSYSTNPADQSEMAVLGKINSAGVLQLRSQQDANQLLAASIEQQMIAHKQAIDAQNRAINQAIYFNQNFSTTMQKVTSGASQALSSISFSIGH